MKSTFKLSKMQKDLVKSYGHLLVNTGGNDVIELIERPGINFQNNFVVASLQIGCFSQVQLLEALLLEGKLK